jgi:hypothetical protein
LLPAVILGTLAPVYGTKGVLFVKRIIIAALCGLSVLSLAPVALGAVKMVQVEA